MTFQTKSKKKAPKEKQVIKYEVPTEPGAKKGKLVGMWLSTSTLKVIVGVWLSTSALKVIVGVQLSTSALKVLVGVWL